jgi:hypothetical protein
MMMTCLIGVAVLIERAESAGSAAAGTAAATLSTDSETADATAAILVRSGL